MTTGKAAGLTLGIMGAIALVIAMVPTFRSTLSDWNSNTSPAALEEVQPSPVPAEPAKTAAPRPRAAKSARPAKAASPFASISASEPRLHERLKPVLARGTRMNLAAEGFQSAEQFATIAHAARNTQVPFVLLKHRVLNEGRSLADAIHEARPDMVDPGAEVARARAEARTVLADLAG
jgi:hypothetical protein